MIRCTSCPDENLTRKKDLFRYLDPLIVEDHNWNNNGAKAQGYVNQLAREFIERGSTAGHPMTIVFIEESTLFC